MRRRDDSFERLLDQCLDDLQQGEAVDSILSRHPAYAERLMPFLHTASGIERHAHYQPSEAAITAARKRVGHARMERVARATPRSASLLDRLLERPRILAAVATVTVIALTAVLLVGPTLEMPAPVPVPPATTEGDSAGGGNNEGNGTSTVEPSETAPEESAESDVELADESPQTTVSPPAMADGNFAFFVSDRPNDIGDFESLTITTSGIQIKPSGQDPWVQIDLETQEADLVLLQGDRALQMWQGYIPEGEYSRVILLVDSVVGILAESGEEIELMMPSGKMHIDHSFTIAPDDPVEFVFDITVHRTGQPGGSAYLLSPQASESGIGQVIDRVEADGAPYIPDDKPGKEGQAPQEGPEGASGVIPPGPGTSHRDPRFAR